MIANLILEELNKFKVHAINTFGKALSAQCSFKRWTAFHVSAFSMQLSGVEPSLILFTATIHQIFRHQDHRNRKMLIETKNLSLQNYIKLVVS
jgi:hypothetical protein